MTLALSLLAAPLAADAQPSAKVATIGYLSVAGGAPGGAPLAETFRQGLQDLGYVEGKTIAIAAGSTQFQQWPAFVKGCGLDASKIRIVNIDPAGSPPALITGQVPAIAGYALGQVPSVEIRGNTKARVFWYADCGVTAVSNCIVVHNDLIKEDPELVRSFIAATLKGFLYGRQNLDEMIAIARKYSPAIEPAIARREAEMSWQSWISPNTKGKPFGWMSEKDWEETVEVLKQYGGVTAPLQAQQLYTNGFVPTGAEFIPPPADADKM